MKKRIVFIGIISIICTQQLVVAQSQIHAGKGSTVAYSIVAIDSKQEIASYNATQLLQPASLFKLFTTATAWQVLGANYQFKTTLASDKMPDKEGTINGNLYIYGGGDPSLGSTYINTPPLTFINQAIQSLKRHGVKKIKGNIEIISNHFDTEAVSPHWSWEDIGNYYASGTYSLNYGDNLYTLTLTSGAEGTTPTIVKITPDVPHLTFVNNLRAAANNKDSAYIYGAPRQMERTLQGTIPANRTAFTIKGDLPSPEEWFKELFIQKLQEQGIPLIPTTQNNITQHPTLLYSYYSPTLTQLITVTNKHSHNLYAEAILREIAFKAAEKGSSTAALNYMQKYWAAKGISLPYIYDGCGLAPMTRVSPQDLTQLLCEMAKYKDFEQSLPLAGAEGTLSRKFLQPQFAQSLRLKTGSMKQVQCYAGYYNKNGKQYAIAIMVNNFTCSRAALQQEIEQFLGSIKW